MTTPTLTCDHCESDIDVAKDPRCVVYDPSGAMDVMCEKCRERCYKLWQEQSLKYWQAGVAGMSIDPDFELACVKRRAPRQSGRRECIDVNRARRLYDKLGTWRAVSEFLRRKSGQAFTPSAIFMAVRWADQGNAGRRI